MQLLRVVPAPAPASVHLALILILVLVLVLVCGISKKKMTKARKVVHAAASGVALRGHTRVTPVTVNVTVPVTGRMWIPYPVSTSSETNLNLSLPWEDRASERE